MSALRVAIFEALAGNPGLQDLVEERIFHQVAPQGSRYPFVVFGKQTGTPEHTFRGPAVRSDLWMVKAVDRGPSASSAEEIDRTLEAVLGDAELTIADAELLYLRRESDLDNAEVLDGETFHHVGGLYRVMVDPA